MSEEEGTTHTYKEITANLAGLPPELVQNFGRAEYEKRFNVKLTNTGRKYLSQARSRLNGNKARPRAASGPAPKFAPNTILHSFPVGEFEVPLQNALKALLPGLLETALKKMGVAIVPPLKVVYTLDDVPEFELRVK